MIGKRKRNKYFQQAIDIVNTYTYLDYTQLNECYEKLELCAGNYQTTTYDRIVIAGCIIHGEITKIPYITRFSDMYTDRLNEDLARVKRYASKFKHGIFLTLTVDPKRFTNPKQMYQAVQTGFNKLMTYLRKQYGTKYYIKTVEFTATHLPHIHVMIFIDTYIPIQKIRELWNSKYNIGVMVRIEYVHTKYILNKNNQPNAIYPLNYIMKYILKTYDPHNNDTKAKSTRIWQWSLQCRSYSISHALVSLIYNTMTNSNSKRPVNPMCSWHYLGSFDPIEAKEWVSVDDVERYLRQLYSN